MARGDAETSHVDVLIVGAGISGIDAAYRLETLCPDRSWQILEGRDRIGGTWDLFRYPGVRSDSDIFTLGFPFRPWPSDTAIVEGEAIRDYVEDTAREFGIFERIRFGHRVTSASWSSERKRWTVETQQKGDSKRFTCAFLHLCSGYYDYDQGYRPEWDGEADFKGLIVHPQAWPEDLDYSGKNVAVIGSGATAITLVPAMAETAAHVTMVQRSPTYIVARPTRDIVARILQRVLPARLAHSATRWKNVLLTIFMYSRARAKPEKAAALIKKLAAKDLPEGYPLERDFSPSYEPWDQRLCLIPDGDLFASIRSGKVSIATGTIERFMPGGLRLVTGEEVAADVIVTATGLIVRLLGGIRLDVDGAPVVGSERVIYKGMMLDGVPNLFLSFGYTNASWTLRSDITARSVCRLLNHMRAKGHSVVTPRLPAAHTGRTPVVAFSSGYVQRALPILPSHGAHHPWIVKQNYVKDRFAMRFGRVDEDLEFSGNGTKVRA